MLSKFFGFTLYVQISPDKVTVRNPRTGECISEPAEIAVTMSPKATVAGIGNEARQAQISQSAELFKPFAHPRSIVSDFTLAEQLLKAFFSRMKRYGVLAVAPHVIVHPLGQYEGGLTQIEVRALYEMAIGAGASQVKVWAGQPLSDEAILAGNFSGGEILY